MTRPALVSALVVPLLNLFALVAMAADVTVVDADGAVLHGQLQSFSGEKLAIRGEKSGEFETDDLIKLEFDGRKQRTIVKGSLVLLANGDVLVVHPLTMDDERIVARWQEYPGFKPIAIPLETVRGCVLQVPANSEIRKRVIRTLFDRREAHDMVIPKNRDDITGEFMGLANDGISLETSVGKVTIPRQDVRAVGFNSDLISFPKVTGRRVLLTLTDASRLTVRNPVLKSNELLECETVFGAKLQLTLSAIVSMRFLGGRVVYLSQLEPESYRFTPYLTTRWELRRDRNVTGGFLRLRGTQFAKGLGMHSKSEVSYRLAGGYSRFRAVVGIDDQTHGRGSAVFSIELDGKRVLPNQMLTGKSPAKTIGPLDVSGGKLLTLAVDFGPFGDVQDHANWCDALLVKPKPAK